MDDKKALPALIAAFPHTLPILAGFVVLGMGYGIYLRSSGLPLWYPTLTSILVFGGSLEFLLVSMLLALSIVVQRFQMALMRDGLCYLSLSLTKATGSSQLLLALYWAGR